VGGGYRSKDLLELSIRTGVLDIGTQFDFVQFYCMDKGALWVQNTHGAWNVFCGVNK